MTIDERADVILSLVDVDKKFLKDGVFEAVRLEIREAVEEVIEVERYMHYSQCGDVAGLVSRTKSVAYEKAATLFERMTLPVITPISVAKALRALAAEEGK